MTMTEWFIFFLVIQVIHFIGTWKLYVKAGRKSWEALVPIYNAIVLMKIINRPAWWVILLFIPIINLLMFPVIWIETIRSFGKNSTVDSFLAVLTLGFYTYYVNYLEDVRYVENRSLKSRTELGEWVSSIVFAIVAATLVHTYVMQPYTIPTSSLEKSLLVGDFLFVSKFHFGARTPMTTVAAPMVHDSIPFIKTKSYLNKPQLPYFRIPGFQDIKRNEIVVFNWPVDTVRFFRDQSNIHIDKPIDKKSNYVKRCVGVPGDSLEIRDGYIYINGEKTQLPDRAKPQYMHKVVTDGQQLSATALKRYNVTEGSFYGEFYMLNLTDKNAAKLKNNPLVKSVTKQIEPKGNYTSSFFPHSEQFAWSADNYGPIYIPEEGKTVELNSQSLPFYKRIIEVYEKNNLTVNGDEIFINGKLATTYTFKQNYYWMMGDNRHNSEDARFWGYVPFDHIVGKPVFIWFSWDSNEQGIGNKIRWERVFTTVHGDGEPVSYLYYFLAALALWFGYSSYRKRKNA
ncbi:MAG: signal peptidase I [Lutibacter sp.]|uniref:signal peptidase I n=1 Tax=Lutibacter sp. TaxID=1925666 RepID=UPI001813E023|nr:signal peptidase I [Lutibacter sp.]MBT8316320.1 signal peptidase I [Lutibacter sp.]NNJ57180.1 signal peptidase I [Lutibacter sp.]